MPGSGPTEGLPVPSTDGSENGRSTCDFGKKQEPRPAPILSQPLPTVPLPPPYQLQEVVVPIVGNEVCDRRYQNSSNYIGLIIKDDMLCAGSEGQDSCQVRPVACQSSSVPFWPMK